MHFHEPKINKYVVCAYECVCMCVTPLNKEYVLIICIYMQDKNGYNKEFVQEKKLHEMHSMQEALVNALELKKKTICTVIQLFMEAKSREGK